jgi:hypothetical protein
MDPTPLYIRKGLALVSGTASLWKSAEGNSTSSHGKIGFGEMDCEVLTQTLLWLSEKSDIANKRPEICLESWSPEDIRSQLEQILEPESRLWEMIEEVEKRNSEGQPGTSGITLKSEQ